MLSRRLFFGALLILLLIGLVWADARLSASVAAGAAPRALDGLIVTIVLAVLVALGSLELHRLFVSAGHVPLRTWIVLTNVALVAIPYLGHAGLLPGTGGGEGVELRWSLFTLTAALLGTYVLVARRKMTHNAVGAMATTLLAVVYYGLLPQFLVRLRLGESGGSAWLLLYVVGTVKACDIGAYFTGLAIGRHKLIAWLSPKKTIEGLVGGLAWAVAVAVVVPLVIRGGGAAGPSAWHAVLPDVPGAILFGLAMGVAGQAGDLMESLMKRDAQVKDSARSIPAFGGVLDILDSPLVAAPIAFWMLLE